MVIRVAVVDDDDVSRRGLVELLGEQPDVHVVAALTHLEAVTWTQRWDVVDVAIVDACDERRSDDQFPGVSVVEGIRARRSRDETRVIVRTGQFFDDAVRRRMREADADYFFHRSELQDVSALRAVVLHPERFRSGVPDVADPSGMLRLGVGRTTRVNQAVAAAVEGGLVEAVSDRSTGSRSLARRRHSFNQTARLCPMNSDGTVPDRNQTDPSMPQIARFLQWATRTKTARP
jgi:DNA-binding NarL/FixJ family response regulator